MKKHLVKAIALFAVLALSVTLFAGCGGNDTAKDEQGRTILSVGGWPDKEGKSLDNINARKARFEETNPDVVIEPDHWAFDRNTFYEKQQAVSFLLFILHSLPICLKLSHQNILRI